MLKTRKLGIICFAVSLAVFGAGCKKKTPIATPAPTPPPAAPATDPNANTKPTVLEFSVEPSTVERGQSAVLKWSVSNANAIQIDNGIGDVQSTGNRRVIPSESTTYHLTAAGPNGTVSASATVNVTGPAAPPPSTGSAGKIDFTTAVNTLITDAYFDYDSNNIRADARDALNKDADALKKIFADFPNASVIVEGHCDERGSAEYNLGLGDQRASSAKQFLVDLGVPADRLKTVSYGKERPQCTEATEDCYQRNRRAHFAAAQ
ncbi:MAG: OmpA/MotB domain protein [Bryobacterales bacterium]|nr:OmpA/MotB domain protein [Bryobacterales bacterium]